MKSFLQYLKEDYDQTAKQDAEDSETISNRAKDPKIRKAWKGAAKKLKKTAVTGLDEEQLDELKMDHKTYVAAMKRATDYEADYAGDANRIDTDKLVSRAKKNKGEKFAKDLAGADQMTERPNRNKVSGQWGNDQLAWRKPSRSTKDGKANKIDLKSLKGSLTKGDYRKPSFKKRDLPESEQLDEVSAELAQRASDAAQNKSRKLSSKYMRYSNKTNKDKKFRGGIAKQEMKAIKQHIKFSDYAAKKSMKEETLNELHGKGSLEKIRDYHKKKVTELGKRANKVADTVDDRRAKKKDTVVVTHNDGKKTVIPGKGEAEFTSVERNRNTLFSKRDLASMNVKRATGLIKKRKSLDEEQLDELHGKSKEAMKLIKKRIEKKHDAEWEATYEKRKKEKLKGSEKTKKEDKSRNDLAKRWLRADKAEKKLDEVSASLADRAYKGAKDKLLDNDIMVSLTKGSTQKKWLARSNKKRDQAVKFANYADKKKYEARKKLEETSAGKIGNYVAKASDQKSEIQDRGYADKLEKGDLRKFEKRKKGVQMAIRKLTGQAKVPAKVKKKESFHISRKTRKDIDDALKRNIGE